MKRLIGLALKVKDTNNEIWTTDYWQELEEEKISKIALEEVKAIKKEGWRLIAVSKYWTD